MKLFSIAMILAFAPVAALADRLRILTWEEYIAPDVVMAFEQETGISLEFIYFENDEARDQIMAETTGFGFDLVLVDDTKIEAYIQQNWIRPIRMDELAEYGSEWQHLVPEAVGYAMPYGYGNYGILYRNDLVPSSPTRWADLMDPSSPFAGKIIMPGQYSELLIVAQLVLPPSRHSLDETLQLLVNQKPLVHSYQTLELSADSALITGEAWVAVSYNSDALVLKSLHGDLTFITPEEGTALWIDFWAISAYSRRVKQAEQFLAFLSRPQVVAENIEYTFTASFHSAGVSLLNEDIRTDSLVFPDISAAVRVPINNRESFRLMMQLRNELGF